MFSRWMLVVLVLAAATCGCSRHADEEQQATRMGAGKTPPFAHQALRRRYPHSLIPGGVESVDAFQEYRTSDRVLREHFGDLGRKIVATKLSTGRWMYASYRVGDRIFWTHNRILVHEGEALFTDGKWLVRARCGNRLSESPERPVLSAEPPSVSTDRFTVEIAVVTPPDLAPVMEGPELPGFPGLLPPDSLERTVVPGSPRPTGEELVTTASTPALETTSAEYRPPLFETTPATTPGAVRRALPTQAMPTIPTPESNTWATMLAGLVIVGGHRLQERRERRDSMRRDGPR